MLRVLSSKPFLLFAIVTLLALQPPQQADAGVVSGPTCYRTCTPVCCMMGALGFAKAVKLPNDFQGCSALCMVVCARGLAIPGICFANTTTFMDEHMQPVNASVIKVGDVIQTMVPLDAIDNNNVDSAKWVPTPTKVTMAAKIDGPFRFVRIQLAKQATDDDDEGLLADQEATTELTVTERHGVIVLGATGNADGTDAVTSVMTETMPAMQVSVGQKMVGVDAGTGWMKELAAPIDSGVWVVKRVDFVQLPWQHVIQTEAGTALASGLLTTTSCVH